MACANQSLPTASPVARWSGERPRRRCRATETCLFAGSCTSVRNAGVSPASPHLVTVTHPFHPYSGQGGVCIARRGNRSGKRWLLRFADGRICSVPPQWTDAATPDLAVSAGDGRALCSLADLLELAEFVAHLMLQRRDDEAKACKDKYAATVKQKTPQHPWSLR